MTVRTVRVHEARDVAQAVLSGLPSRWRHTVGVARCAEELAATLDADDGEQLVAAAWLHDIGYAEDLVDTGFHPLDGARFLDRHRWPSRISALVAHHSGAAFVATARGLDHELRRHGPESPNACVHHVRGPYLLAVAERVERQLRSSGVSRAGDPRR